MKPSLKNTRLLIVGGGIAGLSIAAALTVRGFKKVTLLEKESSVGTHASGRNAGMIRRAVEDLEISGLLKKTLTFFESPPTNFPKFSFVKNGSLLLVDDKDIPKWENLYRGLNRQGIKVSWISKNKSLSEISAMEGARFKKALFSMEDGFVDIDSLLNGFLKRAVQKGVMIKRGFEVKSVTKKRGEFLVKTRHREFRSDILINAAGAWAGKLAGRAGALPIPLTSYKRHLYQTEPVAWNTSRWPFVWDVSHGIYFRPQGEGLLLCPCDEEKVSSLESKVNTATKGELLNKVSRYLPGLSGISIVEEKAGLRTFSPDRRFVIGWDPQQDGFFWAAGLGGHGITSAPALGEFAADIVLGKKKDSDLKRVFSPERFL